MTSLALEGQSYTILKSAPVTGRHVWQAKAMSVWLPYAVTVTLLMIVAWAVIRFNPLWGIYGVLCLLIMGAGLIALNTALGFRYANLEWTDPRRMNSGGGSFYSFILSVIYLLIAGLTALLFFVLAAAFPGAAFLAALGGLAAVGLITLAVVWLSGRWAESAWRRLGEA
jgi:hypothetical protein